MQTPPFTNIGARFYELAQSVFGRPKELMSNPELLSSPDAFTPPPQQSLGGIDLRSVDWTTSFLRRFSCRIPHTLPPPVRGAIAFDDEEAVPCEEAPQGADQNSKVKNQSGPLFFSWKEKVKSERRYFLSFGVNRARSKTKEDLKKYKTDENGRGTLVVQALQGKSTLAGRVEIFPLCKPINGKNAYYYWADSVSEKGEKILMIYIEGEDPIEASVEQKNGMQNFYSFMHRGKKQTISFNATGTQAKALKSIIPSE